MLSTDLHLLRDILNYVAVLESRIRKLEEKSDEMQDSLDFLENEVPHLRHLVHQNEDLENQLAFYYPPD